MAYDMYQEIILQHYRSPRNFGPLPGATSAGEESNPLCGDRIRLELKVGA
ncbi:MAG: iron-sulfur cluster assembly scaffold protein, partial [Thermoplasmata archaeon]